jgi:hypothetical protein
MSAGGYGRMAGAGGMMGGGISTGAMAGKYGMGYGAHLDYDYDDSYGGEYQMDEEDERDPYAFDIDIDTKPSNKNAAKGIQKENRFH